MNFQISQLYDNGTVPLEETGFTGYPPMVGSSLFLFDKGVQRLYKVVEHRYMANKDKIVYLEVVVVFEKQALEPTFEPCLSCGAIPVSMLTQCSKCGFQNEQQKSMVTAMGEGE